MLWIVQTVAWIVQTVALRLVGVILKWFFSEALEEKFVFRCGELLFGIIRSTDVCHWAQFTASTYQIEPRLRLWVGRPDWGCAGRQVH